MALLNLYKVVASLPDTLEPNTIYAVRVGSGFDLYITDMTGSIAYKINSANSENLQPDYNYIKNVYSKKLGVIIPYYQYPYDTTTWTDWSNDTKRLINALKQFQSPALVIVNPANGAGTQEDIVYRRFIKLIVGANALPVGYIYYSYGNRNLNDVLADIDKWKTIYPMVNALFIDEIPYDANVSELNYIISYARAKGFKYIIGNPGTPIPENKTLQLQFDNLVVQESNSYQVNTTFEGNWEDSYREQSKTKFSGIIYGVSKGIDYHFFYNFQKYFSYVYVCNNYNTLPSYFEELLGYIDALSTFKPNIISNPLPPKTYWLLNITSNTYLTNLTLVSSRFYLMPFITETKLKLNELAIYVNTASSGTCFTGIYSSVNNRPSTLLTNVLFNVGTTQEKIQPVNIELAPNTVYFFGLVSTSNPT
ncbi:MAG: spherulation-specific family 4 protein, partial [Candidatus Aenigmatarchaeota archaeon]